MKFFSFENDTPTLADDKVADALVESTNEVAAASSDTVEAVADVDAHVDALEDGVEASSALTDVGAHLQEKVDSGEGITEGEARLAEITIESIRVRLQLPASVGRMPSLESFRSPRSRQEATRFALENAVTDTLKKIWEGIKKFAAMIWEKIKDFFAGLTKSYERLEGLANTLRSRLSSATGEPDKKTLESGSLAQAFSVNGTADSTTVGNTFATIDALFTGAKAGMDRATAEIGKVQNDGLTAVAANAAIAEVNAAIVGGNSGGRVGSPVTNGDETTSKYLFPGGKVLEVVTNSAHPKMSFKVEDAEKVAKEIVAMTKDQCTAVLDTAFEQIKKGKVQKDILPRADKILKTVQTSAEKQLKILSSGSDADKKSGQAGANQENLKRASELVGTLSKTVQYLSVRIPSAHFNTTRAALHYVSASISNLKDGSKK